MSQEINEFNISNFNYELPQHLIAQEPARPRDSSRLLIVNRKEETIQEGVFPDILNFINKGDILVLNNTKVFNARLFAKREGKSKVEILLLKEKEKGIWEVLAKPAKRAMPGDTIIFEGTEFSAKVLEKTTQGGRLLHFYPLEVNRLLEISGKPPTPPYVKQEISDSKDYQTVYAEKEGAVAAPTAGFHFTQELLKKIKDKSVEIVHLTLHCSLATFRPVKVQDIRNHIIEGEYIDVALAVVEMINKAKEEGRRIIAVGTTSVRSLESAAFFNEEGNVRINPFSGETKLYITPGYKFKIVDSLITNFHTPCSTNLILTSTFCGRELLKKCYDYAINKQFRFYSFGDAMMIV